MSLENRPTLLWQVTGPWFCAGLVTIGDRVVAAAPILRSMGMGSTRTAVRAIAMRRGFTVRYVPQKYGPSGCPSSGPSLAQPQGLARAGKNTLT